MKDYAGASAQYGKLAAAPQFRDRALFYGAYSLKEAGRLDEAIKNLETLTSQDVSNAQAVQAAMLLMAFYGEKGDLQPASAKVRSGRRPREVECHGGGNGG